MLSRAQALVGALAASKPAHSAPVAERWASAPSGTLHHSYPACLSRSAAQCGARACSLRLRRVHSPLAHNSCLMLSLFCLSSAILSIYHYLVPPRALGSAAAPAPPPRARPHPRRRCCLPRPGTRRCAPPRPHLRVRRMASCRFCSEVLWYSMGAHCSRRGARERRLLSTHGEAACACCGRFPPRRAALRPAWCCCGRPAAGAGALLLCWDGEQSRAAPQPPPWGSGLPLRLSCRLPLPPAAHASIWAPGARQRALPDGLLHRCQRTSARCCYCQARAAAAPPPRALAFERRAAPPSARRCCGCRAAALPRPSNRLTVRSTRAQVVPASSSSHSTSTSRLAGPRVMQTAGQRRGARRHCALGPGAPLEAAGRRVSARGCPACTHAWSW